MILIPKEFGFTLCKEEFAKYPKVKVNSRTVFHAKLISSNKYLVTWKKFLKQKSTTYYDYQVLQAINDGLWLIK
jgi:hypothetical protein